MRERRSKNGREGQKDNEFAKRSVIDLEADDVCVSSQR